MGRRHVPTREAAVVHSDDWPFQPVVNTGWNDREIWWGVAGLADKQASQLNLGFGKRGEDSVQSTV